LAGQDLALPSASGPRSIALSWKLPPVFYPLCGFAFNSTTAVGRRNKRRGASVEDLYTSGA
jgi:hypothetical protein